LGQILGPLKEGVPGAKNLAKSPRGAREQSGVNGKTTIRREILASLGVEPETGHVLKFNYKDFKSGHGKNFGFRGIRNREK
jgi:hypothetical protein